MLTKICKRIKKIIINKCLDEHMEIELFSRMIKKYDIPFIYKDSLNILIRREYTDNFSYIFKTKNSCDAMPMMKALDKMIKKCSISIDVGANIGITSIWLAKNSEVVYSFEPEEKNVKRFNENIKINNIKNVKLLPLAVTNYEGEAELNIFENYGHHSLGRVDTTKFIKTERIKTITLDRFCFHNNISSIDCLKIDVEGFELEVLQGAQNLLREQKIKIIIFEISKILLDKLGKDLRNIFDFLSSYGYSIFDLQHKKIDVIAFNDICQEDLYAIVERSDT